MNNKKLLACDWIKFAEDDLEAAKVLMKSNPHLSGIIVFHAQQAAEKIIKAFLIHVEIPFGKIHDLNKLLSMIEIRPEFSASLYDTIELFEKFAVEVRYPDGEVIPTFEEAIYAIASAEKVLNYFKTKINVK